MACTGPGAMVRIPVNVATVDGWKTNRIGLDSSGEIGAWGPPTPSLGDDPGGVVPSDPFRVQRTGGGLSLFSVRRAGLWSSSTRAA
jgi:hypothetical protein